MQDIRYSELLFLQAIAKSTATPFLANDPAKPKAFSISPAMYVEMAATLVEDLYIRFQDDVTQLIVARLRGELAPHHGPPGGFAAYEWANPRDSIRRLFGGEIARYLCITYRGLRRIEELRDLLRRDRILEHFGVLLDMRYFLPDLQEALSRGPDIAVSVIYADMDHFKPVNDRFGHEAGDAVMKAYLEVVRDSIAQFGSAYRGCGDETVGLVLGQGHERAVDIAETIRKGVAALDCQHKGESMPRVTASIGVASTPPEPRSADIETLADARNRKAKELGRNRVVAD
jgi:diguanylate cyclase (GGDEF)-like protein